MPVKPTPKRCCKEHRSWPAACHPSHVLDSSKCRLARHRVPQTGHCLPLTVTSSPHPSIRVGGWMNPRISREADWSRGVGLDLGRLVCRTNERVSGIVGGKLSSSFFTHSHTACSSSFVWTLKWSLLFVLIIAFYGTLVEPDCSRSQCGAHSSPCRYPLPCRRGGCGWRSVTTS
jgi:hypothetical protein